MPRSRVVRKNKTTSTELPTKTAATSPTKENRIATLSSKSRALYLGDALAALRACLVKVKIDPGEPRIDFL
jgi:hypothetical protein